MPHPAGDEWWSEDDEQGRDAAEWGAGLGAAVAEAAGSKSGTRSTGSASQGAGTQGGEGKAGTSGAGGKEGDAWGMLGRGAKQLAQGKKVQVTGWRRVELMEGLFHVSVIVFPRAIFSHDVPVVWIMSMPLSLLSVSYTHLSSY